MRFGKKQLQTLTYDPTTQKPVLKCSICNGEQVAGFKNLQTGKIEEVMFVKDAKDLQNFMETYQITEPVDKIY